MIFGKAKHLTDNAGRFANVLVDNGRGDYLEKGGGDVGGECTSQEGFAGARWSVEEYSFGCLSSSGRGCVKTIQVEIKKE